MKYLTNRQEIAKAMNFGQYPVIRINMETCKDGYNDFFEGDLLKVMCPRPGHPSMWCSGNLYYSGGKFGVMTDALSLTEGYGYRDVMEDLARAQAPVVKAGQVVVMIEDFPKQHLCKIRMMQASDKVDMFVYPCVTFHDVPDDFVVKTPEDWD